MRQDSIVATDPKPGLSREAQSNAEPSGSLVGVTIVVLGALVSTAVSAVIGVSIVTFIVQLLA